MSDHPGAGNVHTRRIAEFVSTLSYERIPAQVIERIKLLILDSLGCAIYGAQLEWCRILRQTLESLDATRTTSAETRRLALPAHPTTYAIFEIVDTGPGIAPDELPQIYLWYPANVLAARARVGNIQIEPSGSWYFITKLTLE